MVAACDNVEESSMSLSKGTATRGEYTAACVTGLSEVADQFSELRNKQLSVGNVMLLKTGYPAKIQCAVVTEDDIGSIVLNIVCDGALSSKCVVPVSARYNGVSWAPPRVKKHERDLWQW